MGGVDKGLELLHGRPLAAWVLERLLPQVASVSINANQNVERYAELGVPVIADRLEGFAGPLAGMHAGLAAAPTAYLVTVPCDSPFLPPDLVARLHARLSAARAQLAVAKTGDQPHPVFALCRIDVLASLEAYLAAGGRKIDAWYAALETIEVPFDDEAEAFANINTREELSAFAARRAR